ncbi:glycosyltransferase family 2 protein [Pseudoxanthomonas sp. J31]|uniref:glycosyltransferase family 2 protein n=1 Tax=Pseudoxanthomonas sp. J31 TaxID=935851 RepID=UPI000A03B68F|nr:glycosyltransferase family 2 protein [Pseudoxanthomonas sp. J31]
MSTQVTIILPFFNAEEFLEETLASVENQTFPHWKIILVDDGSIDRSLAIAKEFKDRNSERTVILNSGGVGAARARNIATEIATSKYLAFLDADDIWRPEKLDVQLREMQENGSVFSYTAFRKITPDGAIGDRVFRVPSSIDKAALLKTCPIRCFTVIYDQDSLGKLYMPDVKMRNDYLTWFTALERIDLLRKDSLVTNPIIGINRDLGLYRIHPTSLTGNKLKAARYQWKAYRENLNLPIDSALYNFMFYAFSGIANRRKF